MVASASFYRADGRWSSATQIGLRAGWYGPAGGSGQATVTVSLRDRRSTFAVPLLIRSVRKSIQPGSQSGCASSNVGTVFVTVEGGLIRLSLV
jgi:hypothetical protein